VSKRYPAIPEPLPEIEGLAMAVREIKQLVEILTQQRKPYTNSAVTWQDLVDLGLIGSNRVPTTPS
jgi:hypothetical protein